MIAEFNAGQLRYGWAEPRTADFKRALDGVNAVARRAPGFVWMLDEEAMDAAQTTLDLPLQRAFPGPYEIASTLSVWESLDALRWFVHHTVHARFMARRRDWLVPQSRANLVIWPIEPGRSPSLRDAVAELEALRRDGPSAARAGLEALTPLDRPD